jgi:hypothetical protein
MILRTIFRRTGLPALFLFGVLTGSMLTGHLVAAQPHMQNALNALNTAKQELQWAESDKGGHRTQALGYVNSAIAQVQAGIAWAAGH